MKKSEITKQDSEIQTSALDGLYKDACLIIDKAQQAAYHVVNETLIKRNWLLGMRIQHEVLKEQRAEYGEKVIKNLAKALTERYDKGFTWRNLYNYMDFYQKHKEFFLFEEATFKILHAVSAKSEETYMLNIFHAMSGTSLQDFDILNSLRAKSPIRLSWTHYRIIL